MKQHLRAVGSFFMRSGLGEKALHIDVYDELRARLSLNCTDSEDLMLEYFRHLAVDVVSACYIYTVHIFKYWIIVYTIIVKLMGLDFKHVAPCSLSFSCSESRSGSSFKMNHFWTISHYLFKKTRKLVYIDLVNIVLYLKCIRLKYPLEAIN